MNIYKECLKRNITSLDSEPEKQGLMLIARKFRITEFEKAEQIFYTGQETLEKREEAARKAEEAKKQQEKNRALIAKKAEEKKIILEQKQQAMLTGKNKYTYVINKEISLEQKKYNEADKEIQERGRRSQSLAAFSSFATSVYSYEKPVQEENWAIHGGIANAIAGPAAGLATAMDVQRRNAEAKEEAARDRQRRANELQSVQSTISSARSKVYNGASDVYKEREKAQNNIDNLKKQLEIISDKLIDDSDTEKKFEMLTFNNFMCSLSEAGNIEVTGEAILNRDVYIATSAGWLDGSVKLTVLDSNDNPVACGYYAGKYSISTYRKQEKDLPSVTFGCQKGTYTQISALCSTLSGKSVSSPEGLSIQVEPVHMWIIEK